VVASLGKEMAAFERYARDSTSKSGESVGGFEIDLCRPILLTETLFVLFMLLSRVIHPQTSQS
jgi:hypothetical protein